MKTTDQLAAEAAEEITMQRRTGKFCPEIVTAIIEAAIEKALDDYDAKLDRIQNGKGQGIMHESRAAHASEQPKAEPWTAEYGGTMDVWIICVGGYPKWSVTGEAVARGIAAAHNATLGAQSADTKRE